MTEAKAVIASLRDNPDLWTWDVWHATHENGIRIWHDEGRLGLRIEVRELLIQNLYWWRCIGLLGYFDRWRLWLLIKPERRCAVDQYFRRQEEAFVERLARTGHS